MNNFEKFKLMNVDELADWIDKHGQFDNSPWMEWFDKTYCKNCESIMSSISKWNNIEVPCSYCELNDKCKFFPDLDYIPDNKDIIEMWLVSEVKKDKKE